MSRDPDAAPLDGPTGATLWQPGILSPWDDMRFLALVLGEEDGPTPRR